ncbi:ASCH domain-containing protein [Novipirellula sp. SH528]|uniref:ASCH domain-containing protein n=1 Tax=Novipirellula sp. SH528 TaxID=3454466 RepID=UPI003FA1540B
MLFLSIHPQYVQAIVEGRKTVELRKRCPRAEIGSTVVIYATMPQCEVVATAILDRIEAKEPAKLWRYVRAKAAVTKDAYDTYFADVDLAVGIHLTQIRTFDCPIALSDLRESWQGFQPPQQFRYLSARQQELIALRRSTEIADSGCR